MLRCNYGVYSKLASCLVDADEQVAGLDVAMQDGRRARVQVLQPAGDGADDEQQLGGVPPLGNRVVQHHLQRAAREELLRAGCKVLRAMLSAWHCCVVQQYLQRATREGLLRAGFSAPNSSKTLRLFKVPACRV